LFHWLQEEGHIDKPGLRVIRHDGIVMQYQLL